MRAVAIGLLAALVALPLAAPPAAAGEPIVDVSMCFVDVREPGVVSLCVQTWDTPPEFCVVLQIGRRVLDPCIINPSLP